MFKILKKRFYNFEFILTLKDQNREIWSAYRERQIFNPHRSIGLYRQETGLLFETL